MFNNESLSIIQTTDIVDFIPLLKELEFGDQFSLAMLQWCGIGQGDQSICFWQVYIAKLAAESIGVMGLYQLIDTPSDVVWMGWFGLRPHFRRQGWGTIMLDKLKEYARSFKFQELWVFTNYDNLAALSFYENHGFVNLGAAVDICPGKTHELSDIILKYRL
ncbi:MULTISPECIES: GNAT family N-acetyltransferase [Cyanophyceae]|uniref:GNAT family N-acetyltransferase n=1 Tax=Cyanophyceae TaxID=3028117 RepID=UPI00232D6E18|nr:MULTISPECIES: GNAT family N-acetyltransferase [Cyanophyceae]MDB9355776.1 GNAT family N-acetyltransferase [Nodularia spumigena CS-587/03]MDB9304268.1 GNAT family N-acetyltransferase [Nodularia spumigena CS-591/12]MDB9340989.1 GNAT family N-acetyltransferase [Nodularia spumigena CS-589/07]MDB9341999.1 GNAT family N-acetyltransferase [Nodularia spumigena CS-588/06]MDB9347473.1 GNAT family N-acetyltransferase [Nodularia spumigena CS-588/01]